MRIAQEEVFGPVLPVIRYDDLDEAVTFANATEYGLAGYVWARDIRKAHRLARAIECGNIFINTYRYASEVPFGGYKRSGYGREHGLEALREHTQVKSVLVGLEPWKDPVIGL
jgi:acyl-CoA reductase-like NAD-dependent aldehyde dehydrogenase